MKKYLLIILLLSGFLYVRAQSLPGINYQALLRDNAGQPLANENIVVQASVLDGLDSLLVYKERHELTTNSFGQINLNLGEGETITGSFAAINWGNGPYFLKTGVDLSGSGTFQELEVVKFYSVPFAMVSGGIPAMTSIERDAIENPGVGMQIFNTSRKCIEFFTGMNWESSIPAGNIQPYGGSNTDVPDGWMFCDGSPLSRTDFADLYQAIGVRFGSGDYQSTFNLPDLRGMFLRGANNGRTDDYKDPDVNSRTANGLGIKDDAGSVQVNEMKSHRHSSRPQTSYINPNGNNNYTGYTNRPIVTTGPVSGGNPPIVPWTEYEGGFETRPNNIYVNYIIKF
jgi:microcystin-dependent protein